jgi:predicted thioesterase
MQEIQLKPGITAQKSVQVAPENTAAALGSGRLAVFATPAMIALMERCAAESVGSLLPEGYSSVGTKLDVKHLAATPVGMIVHCETELTEVDRRRLVFRCRAYDEAGLIGEGTQERFIVENERFMKKAMSKEPAGS